MKYIICFLFFMACSFCHASTNVVYVNGASATSVDSVESQQLAFADAMNANGFSSTVNYTPFGIVQSEAESGTAIQCQKYLSAKSFPKSQTLPQTSEYHDYLTKLGNNYLDFKKSSLLCLDLQTSGVVRMGKYTLALADFAREIIKGGDHVVFVGYSQGNFYVEAAIGVLLARGDISSLDDIKVINIGSLTSTTISGTYINATLDKVVYEGISSWPFTLPASYQLCIDSCEKVATREELMSVGANNTTHFIKQTYLNQKVLSMQRKEPLAKTIAYYLDYYVHSSNQMDCGSTTPLSVFGQQAPFIATPGESLQFSTIVTPKNGFPHMGYRWSMSDISGIASTTVSPFEAFTFNTAGEKAISVTPVLADGTVCPAISASINVSELPVITDHNPKQAFAGQVTTFTFTGNSFSSNMSYSIMGCVDVTTPTIQIGSMSFTCKPTIIGDQEIILRKSLNGADLYKNKVVVKEAPPPVLSYQEQVNLLNQIMGSGVIEDCDSKLTDSYLRNSCYDSFIMNKARALNSESICGQVRIYFHRDECISRIRMNDALLKPYEPGVAPADACSVIPDFFMRSSCIDSRENTALNNALSSQKVTQQFCDLLTVDRMKNDCISHISM